jgi:hypothetical protein
VYFHVFTLWYSVFYNFIFISTLIEFKFRPYILARIPTCFVTILSALPPLFSVSILNFPNFFAFILGKPNLLFSLKLDVSPPFFYIRFYIFKKVFCFNNKKATVGIPSTYFNIFTPFWFKLFINMVKNDPF